MPNSGWGSPALWEGLFKGWLKGLVMAPFMAFGLFLWIKGHYFLGSLLLVACSIISWCLLRPQDNSPLFRSLYAVWGPPGPWLIRRSEDVWRLGLGRLTIVYIPVDLDIFVLAGARDFVKADKEGKPIQMFEELGKYPGEDGSHVSP